MRETFQRILGGTNLSGYTSGVLNLTGIYLTAGDVVGRVAFCSGSTPLTLGSSGNHLWAALYDPSGNLLRQSADDTAAAWGGGAVKVFTFTSYTVTADGWYWIGWMCAIGGTGGVMPSMRGANAGSQGLSGGTSTGWPAGLKLAGTTGSGLTTTAPAGPLSPAAGANATYGQAGP